ncbi:MAG: Hsp33 family molecular chaperone HslO [Actinomycetota bacterium]
MTERSLDLVMPFSVGGGSVRGRLARLGPALDTILAGHGYPAAAASLLAETLALASVLAASLKYDGVFTLQAQGDGPVSLVVADVTSDGNLRGYARFDAERLAGAAGDTIGHLLGGGYLAFTVDQGHDTDRYQGIVELQGDSLTDCAHLYFRQSEQLPTSVKLAVAPPSGDTGWRAAAIMVQRMPAGSANLPILTADEAEDGWRRAEMLMATTTADELVDVALPPERLLWRLYHAEILQTFDAKPLAAHCRCSRSKVEGALRSFPADDVRALADDNGTVSVTCEFCRAEYAFGRDDLERMLAS